MRLHGDESPPGPSHNNRVCVILLQEMCEKVNRECNQASLPVRCCPSARQFIIRFKFSERITRYVARNNNY